MRITLLSSRGQITVPKDIQHLVGFAPRTKIALYPQKNVLLIKPLKTSIVEQTAGSLTRYIPVSKRAIPFHKIREETKRIVAAKLVNKDHD